MLHTEITDWIRDKNCLVTGGTGLIGRQVVDLLANAGAKVRVVSMDDLYLREDVIYVKADLTYRDVCESLIHGMELDIVFHIAGIKGNVDVVKTKPASFFVPLLMFNTAVLEACRTGQVGRVVYTSSIGAYPSAEIFVEGNDDGSPMDTFPGWAKRMAEMQVQAYKIQYGLTNFVTVRPCNVYGPGDNFDPDNAMVIPSLMSRLSLGESPLKVWGDGSAVRDFAYSKDVAEGIIQAAYYMPQVPYLNLGSGKGVSIKELVETLARVFPFSYEWDTSKPPGFPKRVMDISLARSLIGYNPSTPLLEGLKQTWEWFRSNRDEYFKKQNYFVEETSTYGTESRT